MTSIRKTGVWKLRLLATLMSVALGGVFVLSAVAAEPAPSSAPASGSAPSKPLLDFRQMVLDNGLRVITLEDFHCPVVAVQLWYHVGSKNEDPNRQGFAHMFEHMMFRGTDRLGATDFFDLTRATGGWCNATTSFDRTAYVEYLPANQLELALWLESQRMAMLKIDQNSFDTERKVVEEERRMGLNQPYGTLYEKGMAEMFKLHPYRWTPIGRIPDLRASSVAELRAFWTQYYVPNNATLVIVGAVSHADAQNLAKRYFGWIPRYGDVEQPAVREPLPAESRTVKIEEKNAPMPLAGVAFHGAPVTSKDHLTLDLLATILGSGDSSRLYRDLVADKQLAVGVEAWNYSLEQDGVFAAGAALSPAGGDVDKVLAAIAGQIERIRTVPVAERELTKARNQKLRGMITSCLSVYDRAGMLASAAVVEGGAEAVNRRLDEMHSITAQDILAAAQKYLDPNRQLVVTIPANLAGPMTRLTSAKTAKAEEDAPITAEPETVAPPAGRGNLAWPADFPEKAPLAKRSDYKLASEFTAQTLSNGLKVIVVPNPMVPFVSVTLGLKNGAWTEKKPGTCSLALSMLTKGTAAHSEAQLADELETYAISLEGTGGMDSASVTASCLTEHLDRTMSLMGAVVLTPTFPDAEFQKLRKQVRAGLVSALASPASLAGKEFSKRLWGEHPYARQASGELADVDAMTIEDLKQWWADEVLPSEAVLIFAGDINAEKAMALATKTFGQWEGHPMGSRASTTFGGALPPAPTHIYLVDKPGTVQSQIRVGQIGITRHDANYFTSMVMDGYFARGFGSRLNKSVRVQKGLTYGIGGGDTASRFAGSYCISTFSKTATTAEAVKAILAELDRLHSDPPTPEELDQIKSYMLGSFPSQHETPQQVAGQRWLVEEESLPPDYFERLIAAVPSVTADQCVRLANQLLDDARLVIVVVGDAEKTKDELEKIAPVTVIPDPSQAATSSPAATATPSAASAPAPAAATRPTSSPAETSK